MYIYKWKIKWPNLILIFGLLFLTMFMTFLKDVIDLVIIKRNGANISVELENLTNLSSMFNILSIIFAAIFGSVVSKNYLLDRPSSYILKQKKLIIKNHRLIYDSAYKFETHILNYSVSKSFGDKKYLQSILIKSIDQHLRLLGEIDTFTKTSIGIFSKECTAFWYDRLLEFSTYGESLTDTEILEFKRSIINQTQKEITFFDNITNFYKITKA